MKLLSQVSFVDVSNCVVYSCFLRQKNCLHPCLFFSLPFNFQMAQVIIFLRPEIVLIESDTMIY